MNIGHKRSSLRMPDEALLSAASGLADREFEEAREAIAEALASNPKYDVPFEDYRAQFEAEREARRRPHEADAPPLM